MSLRFCLIGIVTVLALWGCNGQPTKSTQQPTAVKTGPSEEVRRQLDKARELEKHGDFVSATKIYFDLANKTKDASQRLNYDLYAISTLLRGGYVPQARTMLEKLPRQNMNKEQGLRYRLQLARIYMVDGNVETAIKTIDTPTDPDIPAELLKEIHQFRAKAFTKTEQPMKAAQEYMMLQGLEDNPDLQREHQQALWEALISMPPAQLQQNRIQPPPDTLSGWLELAYYAKTLSHNKSELDLQLQQWRKSYPGHPARGQIEELFSGVRDIVSISLDKIDQIGLLLPLSGRFKNAAIAVRDGFLAAYYDFQMPEKPKIKIYDVGENASETMTVYEQALSDGADLIIGPLDKLGVNQLTHNPTKVTVPTLALNYTENETSELPNLFQFGLAPEDEARQVAERAWLNGYKNAVAIIPKGKWGERVLKAFAENYQKMDGHLLEFQTYDPSKSDYSLPLRRLLNIDNSEVRFVELKRVLKRKIEFTPRRRQDVDFVFMVAFPRQARLLQPQLKFHYAADLPIFATSHVYAGRPNRNADRDMDGISFCDIPWILRPDQARDIKSMLSRNAAHFNRYRRLYALGIDAFRLIPELSRLATDQYERFDGQTGVLTMDATRRIRRNLSWAIFQNGLPKAIESAPDQIPQDEDTPPAPGETGQERVSAVH